MIALQFSTQSVDPRGPSPLLAVGLEELVESYDSQRSRNRNARRTAVAVRNVLPDAFAPFQAAADELADAKEAVSQLINQIGDAPSREDLIVEEKLGNIPDADAAYADVKQLTDALEAARADVRVAKKFALGLEQQGSSAMNALNTAVSNYVAGESSTVRAAVQTAIDQLDTLAQSMEELGTHTELGSALPQGLDPRRYMKEDELAEVRKWLVSFRTRVGGAE